MLPALVVLGILAIGVVWDQRQDARESARQSLLTRAIAADANMVAPAIERLVAEFGEAPERLLDRLHAGPSFRLEVLTKLDRVPIGSRRGFGYATYLLTDIAARDESLRESALALRDSVRARFIEASGLRPPTEAEDAALNRRIRIAGGAFEMGSDSVSGEAYGRGFAGRTTPVRRVLVDPFRIQEHEVSNQEYRRFDSDQRCPGADRQPAVCVTWYDAMAYAAWLGGALPTEAQWEFTARGPEGRTYPWGNAEPSCELTYYRDCVLRVTPDGAAGRLSSAWRWLRGRLGLSRPSETQSVMSRPEGATPEGVYDLAHNAWEWVSNWFGFYQLSDTLNPRGPETGSWRGLRGGSYLQQPLPGAYRLGYDPTTNYGVSGFRVAWPADRE